MSEIRAGKIKGYHDLRNQRPPSFKRVMVIQSLGGDFFNWPMQMSWRDWAWFWEPTGKPSSTYPTHWRFRQPGDEQYDKLPEFATSPPLINQV